MTSPTGFRDRLLSDLVSLIPLMPADQAHATGSAPQLAARRRNPWPRRLALTGAVAAAVVGGVLVVPVSDGDNAPVASAAWSVDQLPDGHVRVTIRQLSDPAGLERRLRAAGVPSVIRAATPSCARWKDDPPGIQNNAARLWNTHGVLLEIDPRTIRPGTFFAMLITRSPDSLMLETMIADSDHPSCSPVPIVIYPKAGGSQPPPAPPSH
jgi:hypothetical protein